MEILVEGPSKVGRKKIDSQRLRSGFLEELDFADAPALQALSGCADLHRRHAQHQHHGTADQGPPPPGRARPGPADRRLSAADAGHQQQPRRQPRPGGLRRSAAASSRLARELKVPVIALSDCRDSRRCASLGSRACRDLRESGAIEQDADLVLFLWREQDKPGDEGEIDGEVVNLRLAKHRDGPTGEVKLWFRKSQTRFLAYAAERYAEAV